MRPHAAVRDEVHHFAGGLRSEALEMCPAPSRLGLTATPPSHGSAGAARLGDLVGPVVCEVGLRELQGAHLAELAVVRFAVKLEPAERAAYERAYRPFSMLRAAFLRANQGSSRRSLGTQPAREFRRLGSAWALHRETAAVPAGGKVFFPDFTLRRGGDTVYLEIVGYYTPEYHRTKLDSLRRSGLANLIVCIDEDLACDDGEIAAGEVLRYRRRLDAEAVATAAARISARAP
ncbi:MAG: DUF790 family protein [Byssovorax sp.]